MTLSRRRYSGASRRGQAAQSAAGGFAVIGLSWVAGAAGAGALAACPAPSIRCLGQT